MVKKKKKAPTEAVPAVVTNGAGKRKAEDDASSPTEKKVKLGEEDTA
jgi:hypothetical protein